MIDVKKLAEQACLVEDNFFKVPLYRSMGASSGLTVADLEAFAALVLEEAALMAQPSNFSHPDDWTEYAKTRAEVACFIRALKPAKEQKT